MIPTLQILCICAGFGFPTGTASAKRVMLMGRACCFAGVPFRVWHIGPSSHTENTQKKGIQNGVSWEYLSPVVQRPRNILLRALCFFWGCVLLPGKLAGYRKNQCVYLYSQGDLVNFWVLLVCRMLHIPVVQECCEWWPGTPDETLFKRWMYSNIMFRWSKGALPISTLIEKRIKILARANYSILRVPILVDADETRRERYHPPETSGADQPFLFWCGIVDGYKRDPLFLVSVLKVIKYQYSLLPRLILGGPCSDSARKELLTAASVAGLDTSQVIPTGFLPEAELFRLATHTIAALLPLWDDDRSKTRFPTKLGLYAAAGCPVVTSPIGEIPCYLQNGETALFAPPGDEGAWADAIVKIMKDRNLASHLAEKIQVDFLPRVEYRSIGPTLKEWFMELQDQSTNSPKL